MKRLSATLAALCICATASAYEEESHEEFTNSTIKQSEYIQHTLGFDLSETHTYTDREGIVRQQSLEDIRTRGSFREDDGSRPLNHFYDPNTNKTGVGLSALGGRPTPDWALEDAQAAQDNTWDLETGQPEDVACCLGQNYSLHDAIEYLYKALTETNLDVRKENRMKHFYSMGHVLHLVADMGQPEHVRLDQHLYYADDPNLLQQIINGFGWKSLYESYTNRRENREKIISHLITRANASGCENPRVPVTYTRPDFNIATARDLFDDENGNGLAEFTNRNFVSNDTNFDSSRYPSPVASATLSQSVDIRDLYTLCENTPYTGPYRSAPISNITNTELSGSIDFYGSDVTDPSQPGNPVYNDRAASMSIFSKEADEYHEECTNYLYNIDTEALDIRTVNPGCRKYTLNRWNFDRAHEFLVPRIIAYGNELINHTYRGRMELLRPDPEHLTALRLDEASGDIMQLPVSIANTTPGESMEGGKLIAVVSYLNSQGEVVKVIPSQELPGESPLDTHTTYTFRFASTTADGTLIWTPAPQTIADTTAYIQVIYRGKLGEDDDSIVVARKPLSDLLNTLNISTGTPQSGVYALVNHQSQSIQGSGFNSLKVKLSMTGSLDGNITPTITYHLNNCYTDDLQGEFNVDGQEARLCPSSSYRSEESFSIPVQIAETSSGTIQAGSLTATGTEYTLNLGSPIPFNATDLKVVYYHSPSDPDAPIGIGVSDISEPTYIAIVNNTDYYAISGTYYSIEEMLAGDMRTFVENTNIYATTLDIDISMNGSPSIQITDLPAGGYSRFAVLTSPRDSGDTFLFSLAASSPNFSTTLSAGLTGAISQLDTSTNQISRSNLPVLRDVIGHYYIKLEQPYLGGVVGNEEMLPAIDPANQTAITLIQP